MAEHTNIEWADSTLNLQMGCDGCELWSKSVRNCYAGQLTQRYGGRPGWPYSFEKPKLFTGRLEKALQWSDLAGSERPEKPWLNGLPRMVFLNDMGDTFTESLAIDWLAEFLPKMAESPHVFLLLTKRAGRMRQFSEQHPLPPNVWPGVSVTTRKTIGRIDDLLEVQGGGPKWVSAEPILENLDIGERRRPVSTIGFRSLIGLIDWIILGGESGPGARPCHFDWLRNLISRSQSEGTPCFLKQMGSRVEWNNTQFSLKDSKGGDWDEWPTEFRLREVPAIERKKEN